MSKVASVATPAHPHARFPPRHSTHRPTSTPALKAPMGTPPPLPPLLLSLRQIRSNPGSLPIPISLAPDGRLAPIPPRRSPPSSSDPDSASLTELCQSPPSPVLDRSVHPLSPTPYQIGRAHV